MGVYVHLHAPIHNGSGSGGLKPKGPLGMSYGDITDKSKQAVNLFDALVSSLYMHLMLGS